MAKQIWNEAENNFENAKELARKQTELCMRQMFPPELNVNLHTSSKKRRRWDYSGYELDQIEKLRDYTTEQQRAGQVIPTEILRASQQFLSGSAQH